MMVLAADQILVGLNKTRRLYNARMRELIGRTGVTPRGRRPLVCLRNDRTKGLLNGATFSVVEVKTSKKGLVTMRVQPEEEGGGKAGQGLGSAELLRWHGGGGALGAAQALRRIHLWLCAHRPQAQGSQWDDIVLFDEAYAFREHRDRWLYTGLTRAAKRVTVVV